MFKSKELEVPCTKTNKVNVDGSRLSGCTGDELAVLLKLRCDRLCDSAYATNPNRSATNVLVCAQPIVEVLNALMLTSVHAHAIDAMIRVPTYEDWPLVVYSN